MSFPLSQNLDLLRTIFEQAPVLLLGLDREGKICCFNRACEKLSGYSLHEVQGKTPWEFLLPAADTKRQQDRFAALRSQHAQDIPLHDQQCWISKSGERYQVEWSSTILRDSAGHFEHLICVGSNITDWMQYEHQLQEQAAIIDQIHDSVVATDLDGMVTFWNQGAERIFGYTAAERLGRSIAEVYPEDQQQFLQEEVIAPLKAKGRHTVEVIMQRKSGERFYGHLALSMRHDADNQPIGMIGYTQDITAQEQARQALVQSDARLRHIMQANPSVLYTCKPDGDYAATFISPNLQEVFGYPPQQFLEHPEFWAINIHPDDAPRVFANLERLMKLGKHAHEYRFRMADGSYRWVRDELRLIRDDRGKPAEIVGCWYDISDRKAAEEALRAQSQMNHAMFDATPVLIAYLDKDMNFLAVNQAYAAADGKSPDFFIGKNHFALYPNAENEAIFHNVVQTGKPHAVQAKPFEYANNPERGVTHWDWSLTPIRHSDDKVSALVLSLTNVTARIQALEASTRSEQALKQLTENLEARILQRTQEIRRQNTRYQAILNTTNDGFIAGTPSGNITAVNPALCDMLGYREEELLQLHIHDIEAAESIAETEQRIHTLLQRGQDRFDTKHRRKDGATLDVEVSVSLVEIDGEQHVYAFVRDISQRKLAEAQLIQTRDAAERANRAKSEFLARMSHELRTPMNAILGFAQVLEYETLSPQQADFVGEIHRAGDHLLHLIDELLDLARIESGKMHVLVEPVDLHAVLHQALQITQQQRQSKQIDVNDYCPQETWVMADAMRLCQILVNLLSNACKYNYPGGAITLSSLEQGHDILRLEVIDTGPGIPAEKQSMLFRPFERLGAEKTHIDGVGIGLALSKQLAELMGAKLGVTSAPGMGSTFWLELPLVPARKEAPWATPETPMPQAEGQHRYRVLYIEDNSSNRKLIEVMLKRQPDIHLFFADNGRQGLEQAQLHRPDVILLDIQLPDLNGYQVLESLRADPATRDIPVLALTADAMPADIERGMQAGFFRYLTKPVNGVELTDAIRQAAKTAPNPQT